MTSLRAVEWGAVVGAGIGLAEAGWLARSSALPELWLFLYAVVLYGGIGGALGGAGFGLDFAIARVRGASAGRAVALGGIAAATPLVLFIGRYLLNRDVYGELGVPMPAMLSFAAAVFVVDALALAALPRLAAGPAKGLAKPGTGALIWAAVALVSLGIGASGRGEDPRASFAGGPAPAALAAAPNVMVILVDTLRADHLGTYGGAVATPAIDRFAADGIVFEQAFANASWTRASGASVLTGRLPCGHTASTKASRLPEEVVGWPEVLDGAGYTTGALINNINLAATFGFDQGFDSFVYESPAYRFGATESVFGLSMYKVVHKLAEKASGKHKEVQHFYQPADVVLGDASAFVDANRDGRWALFVHLMEPHDPYFGHPVIAGTGDAEYDGTGFARAEVEKPELAKAAEIHALYNGEVAFLDRKLAPFFDELRAKGVYDDTLIILTADHGEEFGEHGGFWHGTTLYDEQLHVPLIVKLPKNAQAGARIPWQVRSVDIAPTLAAAAGVAADGKWVGQDLIGDVSRWRAASAAATPPADPTAPVDPTAPAAVAPPDPAAYARPLLAQEDFEGNQLEALRRDGFKYLRANAGNPRGLPEKELFDVVTDGGESTDLLPANAPVAGVYPADRGAELNGEIDAVLGTCKTGAAGAGTVGMSASECEMLKRLGYLDAAYACPEK